MLQLLWDTRGYLFWLWVTGLVVFVLEKVWPWRKQRVFRRQLLGDLLFVAFNGHYFGVLLGVYLNQAFEHTVDFLGLPATRAWNVLADLPLAWQFVICFPAKDFLEWCVHNLLHRVPWFWQFHKVHHSIEELDAIGLWRYHWFEALIYMPLTYWPFLALGADAGVMFTIGIIATIVGYLNHSNMNITWGPLRYLLNSPHMHVWHHDYENHGRHGQNFGLTLSVWDWLFRTAYWPREKAQPEQLGFEGIEQYPRRWWDRMLFPVSLLWVRRPTQASARDLTRR